MNKSKQVTIYYPSGYSFTKNFDPEIENKSIVVYFLESFVDCDYGNPCEFEQANKVLIEYQQGNLKFERYYSRVD